MKAGISQRVIDRTFFENLEPDEQRNWQYFSAEAFYRYPISRSLRLRSGVSFAGRNDNDTGRFSYQEISPSLELRYKTERVLLNLSGSYVDRNFQNLQATNTDNEEIGLLNLKYYRFRLALEYPITKHLTLTGDSYLISRVSNKTKLNSLVFRGYENYYTGIGLKMNL